MICFIDSACACLLIMYVCSIGGFVSAVIVCVCFGFVFLCALGCACVRVLFVCLGSVGCVFVGVRVLVCWFWVFCFDACVCAC